MANIEHLQTVNVPVPKVYEALTTAEGLSEVWTNELIIKSFITLRHMKLEGSNAILSFLQLQLGYFPL